VTWVFFIKEAFWRVFGILPLPSSLQFFMDCFYNKMHCQGQAHHFKEIIHGIEPPVSHKNPEFHLSF
jgi:hypothetical protein